MVANIALTNCWGTVAAEARLTAACTYLSKFFVLLLGQRPPTSGTVDWCLGYATIHEFFHVQRELVVKIYAYW